MTGTLASLRDWLQDQVHEIRHLAPLAVLAPTKCTPFGHVSDDDLPLISSVPVCEWHCDECARPAAARMRTHAIRNGEDTCRWITTLVCDECLDEWREHWEFELCCGPVRCDACGQTFRVVRDAIPMVRPL